MHNKKISSAATSGLLLASITIISTLIQTVLEPGTAVNLLIWAAKFVGSLWLLYTFVRQLSQTSDTFTYKDGFRYGVLVSFFSSLICASYMFLHYAVIFPDMVAEQMQAAAQMMQSSNPEAVDSFGKIEANLPQIIFVFTLIYYTLIGVIASAIIANYTKREQLFEEADQSQEL
jgi:hypothetical protein